MTTLSDLRSRVLAGSGEDRELDCAIACALAGFFPHIKPWPLSDGRFVWRVDFCRWDGGGLVSPGHGGDQMIRHFLTDLNAVLALVEKRLPGWAWSVGNLAGGGQAYLMRKGGGMVGGNASSPARALLAALLSAEIEKMEASDE